MASYFGYSFCKDCDPSSPTALSLLQDMVKWNSPGWLCSELKCSIKIMPVVWHGNYSCEYGKRVRTNSHLILQNQYIHFYYKPHSIVTTCFYTRSIGTIVIKHVHLPYKWIFLIKCGVITTAVKQFNNLPKQFRTIFCNTPSNTIVLKQMRLAL